MKVFSVFAVIATVMLASCAKDEGMKPAPKDEGPGIYIPNTIPAIVAARQETSDIVVPICRTNTDGEATANIKFAVATGDEAIFTGTMPTSVTFADGEDRVEFIFPVDFENMVPDQSYGLSVTVEENTSIYGLNYMELDVRRMIDWVEDIHVAKYTATLFAGLFGLPTDTWYVLYQKSTPERFYRLITPYRPYEKYIPKEDSEEFFPLGIEEIWAEEMLYDDETYILIDAGDPDNVTIREQSLGFAWSYGEFSIVSAYGIYTGFDTPGVLENGVLTVALVMTAPSEDFGAQGNPAVFDVIDFNEQTPTAAR
ncbi:MAG: hypothetical protein LBV18_00825 [Alistipes sp.]|nr:hypothetical protein [Alistipes sp.]